jgi:alpha,alpha-trehalose-phosphate synthase [UDP-forming]/trehalose-phosphatase
MAELLKAFLEENLHNGSLIIVSNREPYIHKKTEAGIRVEKPAGGLTSAMDDVLKATGGTWVAWGSGSGDRESVDSKNCIAVPPENPSYKLKRVWLDPAVAENYYHGYSNQVLWPLCHITLDRVYFRRRFYEDYKNANLSFAKAILEEAEENSIVWIHDYHLCLLPQILRGEKSELTIAHFWHIPWPDWSVFRVCPQAKEILEGLLGNDLIGFQIPLFVKNFLDCVQECLKADIDYHNSAISYMGHTTRLKAFPISVDYERFNSMALSQRTEASIKKIRGRYRLKGYIGIGVDRLEYTKALIKRLQTINLFFERYERFIGKFTFVQIAVPTRMKEPYLSYKETVEDLIKKINRKYSTGRWKPIIYINTKVEHKDLVAYYRMADIAIISSVYDGMNLVAKEYVASQIDERGVLILSELAGAADELEGAMLVNPYDIEGFSECIRKSLIMPEKEKKDRMAGLRNRVMEKDIYKWVSDTLHETVSISFLKREKCFYLFDRIDELKERLARNKIFLFLDYDGTLTPIVESPEKAVITDEMRSLIIQLKEYIPVAIISGRGLKDIRERVGIEGIIYAGNHGAEIWDGEKIVANQELGVNGSLLKEFLDKLKIALSPIQGVLIEDKGFTASVHFRNAKVKDLRKVFDIFQVISQDYKDNFRIVSGKKVFEIRPTNAWNKGDAVSWIIKNFGGGRSPIYIGDDLTDEDAFMAIKGKGIGICIGISHRTEYYLKEQGEVKSFLKWMIVNE